MSLGLLTDIKVDDRFGVGDLATGMGDQYQVDIDVARSLLGYSGSCPVVCEWHLRSRREARPGSARFCGPLRSISVGNCRVKHRRLLVALASGPGVRAPLWAIPRPYQPSSTRWDPRVLGATNPVWIDAPDGSGRFTCARGCCPAAERDAGSTIPPAFAAPWPITMTIPAQLAP